MQTKILTFLAALAVFAGCMKDGNPYSPESLNRLTIRAVYPEGYTAEGGATVSVVEVSGAGEYSAKTGQEGNASFSLPNGIYRINVRDKDGDLVFNATRDKVHIGGGNVILTMELKQSRAGAVVIREIYCGGCSKAPKEGNYQSDKYIILHNNSVDTYYLDGLCMGSLDPYNSNASNKWLTEDGKLPDFLPVIQAVLMMPGSGQDFPLAPGEDAIIALNGAIDHSQEYPLSVNLNREDVFAVYDPVLFANTAYHPAPGPLVQEARYMEIVIKTGQANAYTLSVNSPAFVIFRAPEGTDIRDFVQKAENVPTIPGGSEKVVAIPLDWVIDGVEVFNGGSSGNAKRLPETIDAGEVTLSEIYKGHTLMRKTDQDLTAAYGFPMLQDSNNSSQDFYETDVQSLHQ